jgi:hypothetical protein
VEGTLPGEVRLLGHAMGPLARLVCFLVFGSSGTFVLQKSTDVGFFPKLIGLHKNSKTKKYDKNSGFLYSTVRHQNNGNSGETS